MKAMVVFESMFGNTEEIAQAIAEGVAKHASVSVCNVDDVPDGLPTDVDLLVVGGPTHVFGLSREGTRKAAAEQKYAELVSRHGSLRAWLSTMRATKLAQPAATFCTRIDKLRWVPGTAAKSAAKRLRALGCAMVSDPQDFFVDDTAGPVSRGELERATQWGAEVAERVWCRAID